MKSLNYRGTGKPSLISPALTPKGYLTLSLSKNGKVTKYRVHRLVAEAFIPNPENKLKVDHINAVRTDNKVANLRWVTSKENAHNPHCRLKKNRMIIQYNKSLYKYKAIFQSLKEAEHTTVIPRSGISKCAMGKIRHAGGYQWKYADEIDTLGNINVLGRLTKMLHD